jgi:hypothetical protein
MLYINMDSQVCKHNYGENITPQLKSGDAALECARPRAQQCRIVELAREYRGPRSVGDCCARGRANSATKD